MRGEVIFALEMRAKDCGFAECVREAYRFGAGVLGRRKSYGGG